MNTALSRVVIIRPGGNDTALVFDEIDNPQYKNINDYIQKKNPHVEQVMFVKKNGPTFRGDMAGGEFCGNATRALGYHLLGGKDGSIDLAVSGATSLLTVTVKNNSASTEMPIIKNTNSVKSLSDTDSIVSLEGITHLVLEPGSREAKEIIVARDIEIQKQLAFKLLDQNNLLNLPASGVMVLQYSVNGLSLLPYVYVKAIDTFFAETACGSGSVAVGLTLAKKSGKAIQKISIRQPSGQFIDVGVDLVGNNFEKASIEGEVEILYDGPL